MTPEVSNPLQPVDLLRSGHFNVLSEYSFPSILIEHDEGQYSVRAPIIHTKNRARGCAPPTPMSIPRHATLLISPCKPYKV